MIVESIIDFEALSVTAVNNQIRRNLLNDQNLNDIWLVGESINVTYHRSGHIYFSLQDSDSIIACTFFSNANRHFQQIKIQNGEKYFVYGSISTYIKRGNYQFNVQRILPAGKGTLQAQIEQLKQKLFKEGLFDSKHKQDLPFLPKKIGIVTAPTGAALQDILSTIYNRTQYVNILIAGCLVQGDGAASSIVEAIQILNEKQYQIDVILISRGGGSAEDLAAYNDERVVRTIFQSRVPTLAAIGHEIDYSLSDLAADATAKTPTEGAINIIADYGTLINQINDYCLKLTHAIFRQQKIWQDKFLNNSKNFGRSHRLLQELLQNSKQQVDDMSKEQKELLLRNLEDHYLAVHKLQSFRTDIQKKIKNCWHEYEILAERLKKLSPRDIMKRGYSIVRDKNGDIIKSFRQVTEEKQDIEVLLYQGKLTAQVLKKSPAESSRDL